MSYGENVDIKPTHLIRQKKTVFEALHWLKQNNILYDDVILNFNEKYCSEDVTEENDISRINVDEYSAVPIDYTPPDVDMGDLIHADTPHIKLPNCQEPVTAYEIVDGEETAFPHLFPFGINGFKAMREKELADGFYFKHRLKYFDGRFRKDITYLLHAVNYFEFLRLKNSASIHMRMRKSTNNHSKITVNDLNNINHNPDLLQNSYVYEDHQRNSCILEKYFV